MQIISYIFPIHNESGNIDLLYTTMVEITKSHQALFNFEFIFINDGSSDNSLDLLCALQAKDPRVTVINFSRNFGHQLAVTAGLDYASGDAVIIMDADLQDPPRVSLELIEKWQEGYDVAYAQRRSRKDTAFKRLTAFVFYWLLSRVADIDIPRNTGDFRLLDRKVVEALKRFPEHGRFLRGLVSYVGFKQIAVPFDRDERHAGVTNYPLRKMIRFASDGIVGFSTVPLKAIRTIGVTVSLLSLLGIFYALVTHFVNPATTVPGWTFIVTAILFVGGIQIIMLSVLGSYIGRIYTESQNRPLYLIEKIYHHKNN